MLAIRASLLAVAAALALAPAIAQPPSGTTPLAEFHATKPGLACTACHPDARGNPLSVTPEVALAAANRQCQTCHGDSAQMAKTSQPKLADPNINPHASHLVAVDCTVCHAGHATVSESYCLKCHAFTMPMPVLSRAGGK
jgi:fumarate reductase flavoprotein subunit